MMDFFTRRREIQQNIKLAIANGEARKVLEVEPPEEDLAAFYLLQLVTLQDFSQN